MSLTDCTQNSYLVPGDKLSIQYLFSAVGVQRNSASSSGDDYSAADLEVFSFSLTILKEIL